MSPAAALSRGRPLVTAVIVAHDGDRWLPRLLATLESQTRLPDRLVAVDTGSRDGTAQLLERALGADAVVTTARDLGFGAAVAAGLAALDGDSSAGPGPEPEHWVWLLHDDLALDPHALANLLAAARADLALVGPKVREWPQRKRLLEMGLTVTGTARRLTGVDPGEYDQGQHDRVTDTLAVGSAGMLVRRSAWDHLGGFDPALPLFGDDLDLGWRAARNGLRAAVAPEAVVFHAEASARGQRSIDAAPGRPRRLAREHALYAVLANCRAAVLPLLAVRLLLGSLLRALGLLLLKAPREAWDELAAAAAVLGRPGRVSAGRRRRRGPSGRHGRRVRRLLAPWWAPYGQGLELVGQLAAEALEAVADRSRGEPDAAGHRTGPETGPVAEEAQNLAVEPGPVTRLLRRPMGLAVTVLVLLSLFAGPPLFGAGLLQGGALLPAPPGAADWWRTYAESWHPVAQGGDAAAPPYVAVLAAAATLLLGKAWLVVHVLFALAVPLTAAAGYLLARRLVDSRPVAVWAAVTYGLLPVLTGAVAQGRLGTVVGAMVTPLVARCALAVATAATPQGRWRAASGGGLLLGVLAAFVPLALPVALVLAAVSWLCRGRDRALLVRLAAMVATALALLLPWAGQLGLDPTAWSLAEAGWEGGLTADPAARWELLLGRPGGAGQSPGWLTAGLVLAAVAALLRADRRGVVLPTWVVALSALAVVLLQQRLGVWPGYAVLLAQGAAVVAAAAAADGGLARLGGASFGWRQPLVAAVALAAAFAPVLAAGWWLFADDPGILRQSQRLPVPAFMADAQRTPQAPRTLLVSTDGPALSAHLSRGPGLYVGQDAVAPPAPAGLTDLAARLVSEPTQQDVAALATYGVEFVLLTGGDAAAVTAVDGAPGLVRSSAGERPGTAWRLDRPAGPVRLAGSQGRGLEVLATDAGSVQAQVGAAATARTLSLGEQADGGWRASLDGRELRPVTMDGWAQGFAVPAAGGELVVEHDSGRRWWLAGQLLVLGAALVFAAPGRRRPDATL